MPLGDTGKYVARLNNINTKALEKLGYEPPPLTEQYGWPGKFDYYDHQKHTAEFLAANPRAWCTNGMRSGKTSSGASATDVLESVKDITKDTRILVLCPVNVMTTAWYREMKAINRKRKYYVCKQSTAKARAAMEGDLQTMIMNHDKLPWLTEDVDKWLGPDGLILVDEAHAYRNNKTDRFKCLSFLASLQNELSRNRWLWLLTGTPVPNSPVDMYHLQKLIDPSRVPASEGAWRKMTMKSWDIMVPVKPGSSRKRSVRKWAPLASAEQTVADAMQPCIRYRTQDCVDMPDQAYSYFECELHKDQKRMIKELIAGYATAHESRAVVAANAGVRVGKILQVCEGAVIGENDDVIEIGAPAKMKCLLELIEQNEGKTLVFCVHKAGQAYIQEQLKKKKISSEIINGDVTDAKRIKTVDKFQTRRTPEVLILHPQCEGMTLTKALISAWWGPPDSNLQWTQANERQRGPDGLKTLVAMLYSSRLEKERYEERIEQDEKQKRTLDIYAEALREFGSQADIDAIFGDDSEAVDDE